MSAIYHAMHIVIVYFRLSHLLSALDYHDQETCSHMSHLRHEHPSSRLQSSKLGFKQGLNRVFHSFFYGVLNVLFPSGIVSMYLKCRCMKIRFMWFMSSLFEQFKTAIWIKILKKSLTQETPNLWASLDSSTDTTKQNKTGNKIWRCDKELYRKSFLVGE